MLLIFHKQPPAYINTSLPSTDQQRQRDLNAIQTALHKFYNSNNQQYPIASRLELNGKDDMLTQKLTPLYLAKLPLDSNTATPYIYTSLTGKSFLLTATLSSGQPYQVTE